MGMSNLQTSGLTEKAGVAHLERDRWPEFERELTKRRSIHFCVHHYGAERQEWERFVPRCRNWKEVERVLNRYKADWKKKAGAIEMADASIYRRN